MQFKRCDKTKIMRQPISVFLLLGQHAHALEYKFIVEWQKLHCTQTMFLEFSAP